VLWLAWNASRGVFEPAVALVSGFENAGSRELLVVRGVVLDVRGVVLDVGEALTCLGFVGGRY
jgi:hypothetical protein